MLEAVGIEVVEAGNGSELINIFNQSPDKFSAIITDVQMPIMDGLDATRKLRQSGCKIPIIVLTADVVTETRDEASNAGATTILAKPIDRNALLETLASFRDEKCD